MCWSAPRAAPDGIPEIPAAPSKVTNAWPRDLQMAVSTGNASDVRLDSANNNQEAGDRNPLTGKFARKWQELARCHSPGCMIGEQSGILATQIQEMVRNLF